MGPRMIKRTTLRFVLDEKNQPVEVAEHPRDFWRDPRRIVGWDDLGNGRELLTEFTGVVKSVRGDLPPLLFETRLFSGKTSVRLERYRTWEEAVEGHRRHTNLYRAGSG